MIDLTGKVVLVTGGSRGIGAATCRVLAQAGACVIVHYGQSAREAQAAVQEIGEGRATALGGDLSQAGIAASLFRDAVAWKG